MAISSKKGCGPHPRPWPQGQQYDQVLLAGGDSRNVVDRYRYWKVEAIKADLDGSRAPLEIAIENFQHDYNIGTIVRAANAFNVSAVHIVGKKQWNRRGAMVTDAYMHIIHHKTVADFIAHAKEKAKTLVGVDIIEGSQPVSSVSLPRNSLLVFGGEGPGLSAEMQAAVSIVVHIEQLGSTRSVNVGVAAGIAMYIWAQQHSLVARRQKK
jgi:tRNA G18 (ribose-2'-O)-methylase SpoU